MKILGLSFGRKMKNCDLIIKHALMEAKEAGASVKFVNTIDMRIDRCTGCGACSAGRDNGKQIRCIIKDDYQELENDILDADGIILATPVYSLAPVGQFKNFIDRFGAAHDRAAALAEQKRRIENGAKELLDERIFKDKYVAYISVGGAITSNWVSMGLPNMHMFGMSTVMKTVGQLNAYDMGRRANPLLDTSFLEVLEGLVKHLVESVGKPYDEVGWYGDEGVCPICHNNIISIQNNSSSVECPICGISGSLSLVNGNIKVEFSDKEKQRARNTLDGLTEHFNEIEDMKKVAIPKIIANKDKLEKLTAKYKCFQSTY